MTPRPARLWAVGCSHFATLGVGIALIPNFNLHQQTTSMDESVQNAFSAFGEGQPILHRPKPVEIRLQARPRTTISFWLILLTVFLQPLCQSPRASNRSRIGRRNITPGLSLLLMAMLGVLSWARDGVVVLHLLRTDAGFRCSSSSEIWGGPERRYAAGKFFLFTFAGSVFTLAGVVYSRHSGAHVLTLRTVRASRSDNTLTGTER